MLFAGLSTLSLPGLSSFVSEFMVLAGTFTRYPAYAVVSDLAIVLAALYILIMYQRTMTGPVRPDVAVTMTDVNRPRAARHGPPGVADPGARCLPQADAGRHRADGLSHHADIGVTDPQPRVSAEGGR